ncbi:DegV family protein [Clostridium cellulovorans]|uniref:DegV family protein n=1 Tax=Clostridium cellulovorans (strain ATCC 35296 / DSM 3052 / OCM 3 / 743B) TaxID=573061 RepID=D9SVB7_CLOC7|nr:DegV family protein [Clostridium cellulovorans]ADL51041.1 degV family protein [Clostridium cellulovorans 743B]
MAIKIITDSTSYIPKEIRESLDIKILSLEVNFEDMSFKETDIENFEFYKLLETKEIPRSSQPPIGEIYNEMKRIIEEGNEIVGVFLSSDMSGTYSTANLAKEMVLDEYPEAKIEIIDSRSNCMQLGYAAIVAARKAKEGQSIGEVRQAVEENIKRSRFLFIPENLVYLKKGGRIGGAGALIGNILKIIPILTVENGVTSVRAKVRTKNKAISAMVDMMQKDNETFKIKEVMIHHINCPEEAQKLSLQVGELLQMKVEICDIGPVIGLHVGPGAIGIVYYN